MIRKVILLVEDNPDDEALTLRALTRNNIGNDVITARDGEEALHWLFCTTAANPSRAVEGRSRVGLAGQFCRYCYGLSSASVSGGGSLRTSQ